MKWIDQKIFFISPVSQGTSTNGRPSADLENYLVGTVLAFVAFLKIDLGVSMINVGGESLANCFLKTFSMKRKINFC